jgi:hypothetical protein
VSGLASHRRGAIAIAICVLASGCWESHGVSPSAPLDGVEVVELEAGPWHTCALTTLGAAYCWGHDMGRASAASATPTPLPGIDAAVALSNSFSFPCVTRAGGAVACFGRFGREPDGRPAALEIPELHGAAIVSSGYNGVCAIVGREVRCGSLVGGFGGVRESLHVVPVDARGVVATIDCPYSTAVTAVRADGEVVYWREPLHGAEPATRTSPAIMGRIEPGSVVDGGDRGGCYLRPDGTVHCWNLIDLAGAVHAGELADIAQIAVSPRVQCARSRAGLVYCRGDNGCRTPSVAGCAPRAREMFEHVPLPAPATDVTVGARHACAALEDGSALCWGNNEHGQLGDGTAIDQLAPTRVRFTE